MRIDKSRIKDAMTMFLVGIGVSVGLGIILGAIFALFEGSFLLTTLVSTIIIYVLFAGWTIVSLILAVFCSDKYITSYSVLGIYYGGLSLWALVNICIPNMNTLIGMLIGFSVAFFINCAVVDTIASRKEKERREYEAECQAFLKGKEAGFKEGYKAGCVNNNIYDKRENIGYSSVEKENKEKIIDEEILKNENDNEPQVATWTQRQEQEFIKLGWENGNKTGTSVTVTSARPKEYSVIMNELLLKTRSDGIYIDPETKEEFNMNDPYDREEAVMAEIFRQEIEQQ